MRIPNILKFVGVGSTSYRDQSAKEYDEKQKASQAAQQLSFEQEPVFQISMMQRGVAKSGAICEVIFISQKLSTRHTHAKL